MTRYRPKTAPIDRAELLASIPTEEPEHQVMRDVLMDLDAAEEVVGKHYNCEHAAIRAASKGPVCVDCGAKMPLMLYKAYLASFKGGEDAGSDVQS